MNPAEIPEEDSEDLLDSEIQQATVTTDVKDLSKRIAEYLQEHRGHQITSFEFRRRKPHLYWRSKIQPPTGPVEVLIFQIDWLGK